MRLYTLCLQLFKVKSYAHYIHFGTHLNSTTYNCFNVKNIYNHKHGFPK